MQIYYFCQSAMYSSFPLLVIALTLALTRCTIITQTSSTYTLQCSSSTYEQSLIIENSSTWYLIQLELITSNSLPIILFLANNETSFDEDNLADYKNMDDHALHIQNNKQTLSYVPSSAQLSFTIIVYRINLNSFKYASNVDRQIQSYDGNNLSKLQCNTPIQFKLTITNLDSSPPQLSLPVSAPPFSDLDCNNGTYLPQTSSCQCPFEFSTPLCDDLFWWMSQGVSTRNWIQPNQRHFFVYEPKLFGQYSSITIKIQLQGETSSKYSYSPNTPKVAFNILWYIQSTQSPLEPPSIFNQMNPSSIDGLVIARGRRLVLTIYKPEWSQSQYYSITISRKQNSYQQFIIILIAVCSAVSALFIVGFVVYLVIGKKLRGDFELMLRLGLATDHRNSNTNKIYNQFFDLEGYFPSLQFSEILKQNHLDSCCSICLETFIPISEIKFTICLHTFHSKCIRQWMTHQQSCPLCRRQFYNKVVELQLSKIGINSNTPPAERCAKIIAEAKKYHVSVEEKQIAEETSPHYDSIDNHLVIDFE